MYCCPFASERIFKAISKDLGFTVDCHSTHLNPSIEEKLFGVTSEPYGKNITKKFSYTLLFMKYYIHTNKLHTSPILLADFVNEISLEYKIERVEA